MAMTTNLPPQAYTRDTLVKAIEWLQTQPPTVRERATSADLLVNIYLQARRRAAVQMEAPVSGENFKSDLKHLVEDLKQFEEPSAPPPQAGRNPSHGSFDMHAPVEPVFKPAPAIETPLMQALAAAPMAHHQPHAPQTPTASASQPKPGTTWQVDAKSLAAAREIQQRLNLSSEGEGLRLLITLGAERARALFP